MSTNTISGIHHITAIASDPQRTLDFYTLVLGLRLVKLTVNFDDPGTYHFYFGNARGSPGSILTFFPWPGVPRGVVGNGQVSAIAFAVPLDALDFWRERLEVRDTTTRDAGARFGEAVLQFGDPDGLPLEIVATSGADPANAWTLTSIPPSHAICGFHSATVSEEGYERTASWLQQSMGLKSVTSEGNRFRFAAGMPGAGAIVDVVCSPDGSTGELGAGTVHHIAWRAADEAQQAAWRSTLAASGYNVTPVMDRMYFRSIYFREPGGVLFEIATDPPGFATDETQEHLGERLMLPAWLEPRRRLVEARLPHLERPAPSEAR